MTNNGASRTPFRGEPLPPVGIEEWVPFTEGENPWQLAGAEIPEYYAQALLPEPEPKAAPRRARRRSE